jgi:hypothetical protein
VVIGVRSRRARGIAERAIESAACHVVGMCRKGYRLSYCCIHLCVSLCMNVIVPARYALFASEDREKENESGRMRCGM